MDWNAILNGAMGAGAISIILKLIDAYSNRNKTRADAAKVIVEGGMQAVAMMKDILADYDRTNDEQAAEIKELQAGKKERTRHIEDLQSQIDNLVYQNETLVAKQIETAKKLKETDEKQAKDLEETRRLRNDYAVAQKQIVSLEDLVIRAGDYIDKMKTAMQKAGIELPLNGELLESVLRLKAERAQRGKK